MVGFKVFLRLISQCWVVSCEEEKNFISHFLVLLQSRLPFSEFNLKVIFQLYCVISLVLIASCLKARFEVGGIAIE